METASAPKINSKVLEEKLAQLEKARNWTPRVISKLEALLLNPDDFQVFRINPLQFAKEKGVEEQESIDLFLHGSKLGLFKMEWQVLCPNCGDTVESFEALNSVHPNYYCNMCRAGSQVHLDDYIQISFTITPPVRDIKYHHPDQLTVEEFYFKYHFNQTARFPGGPTFLEAGAQLMRGLSYLAPGEKKRFAVQATEGALLGHDLINNSGFMISLKGAFMTEADEKKDPDYYNGLTFALKNGKFEPTGGEVRPGRIIIEIENTMASRASILILNMPPTYEQTILQFEPFLTGNRLLTSQTFRTLFRSETVEGGEGIGVRDLTLLFTDLKGSTAMYERIGDLKAFSLVQLHFDRLGKAIQENHGAIVKTIGDAVMASFEKSSDAVKAALEMLTEIEKFNEEHGSKEIILKIGIHRGASIAVTLNERLDYFGQTVNIAARVQGLADAEEIFITKEVFESNGVQELLKGFNISHGSANLKGIQKTMQVTRITHKGTPPPPPPASSEARTTVTDHLYKGSRPGAKRRISVETLALAGALAIFVGVAYFAANLWVENRNAKAQLEQQKKAMEDTQRVAALKAKQDAAMPRCPLIFPLLDKSKKVTPLGSYLSYLAMQRFSYLPQAAFKLPDTWSLFNEQKLFGNDPKAVAKTYQDSLASHFDTQDRGEGQWVKTGSGYKLSLRFWGSKPEKKYQKTFGPKGLHLAPDWIVSCAQDWIGYQPNKDQAAYLANPLYANDDDLKRGVYLEGVVRSEAGKPQQLSMAKP